MSIQTFSKSFLFPNNKRKLKRKFSYYYWIGPWKPTGPRPHSAYADRVKGRAVAWLGASAQASLAQLGRGEGATPASRRHGGAGSASGPAAVAGRVRASGRARGVRKRVPNLSRQLKRMEEGRRTRSTAAEHGGAMTDGGEMRQTLYLGSKGVTAVSTRCRGARRS